MKHRYKEPGVSSVKLGGARTVLGANCRGMLRFCNRVVGSFSDPVLRWVNSSTNSGVVADYLDILRLREPGEKKAAADYILDCWDGMVVHIRSFYHLARPCNTRLALGLLMETDELIRVAVSNLQCFARTPLTQMLGGLIWMEMR